VSQPVLEAAPVLAEGHQLGQAALVSLIPDVLRQAWPLLDLHDLSGTMPAFTAAVRAIVARYGKASSAAAVAYYQSERRAASVPGRALVKLAPTPAESVIESAVSWATTDLYGPVTAQTTTAAVQRLDESVSQLVLDQSRDTLIGTVRSDKAAKGWVRVTEPGACSFCTMLALRAGAGMLYSKRSADFLSHGHCRCHAEPVFTAYEPSARMRDMQALWDTSTKGRSGPDARNAFRQAIEGRPVTGTTGPKTPKTTLGASSMDRAQAEFFLAQAQRMKDSPWRTKRLAELQSLLGK
jgi:hypothetical protein